MLYCILTTLCVCCYCVSLVVCLLRVNCFAFLLVCFWVVLILIRLVV